LQLNIGVQGKESPIFVNLAPPEATIGRRIGQRAGYAHRRDINITAEMRRRKRHAGDAPFVKSPGVWTYGRHVWIYVSPRRRTYTCLFTICKGIPWRVFDERLTAERLCWNRWPLDR